MLYDENGKPVEGALTPEEVQAQIGEKEAALAEANKKIEEFNGSDKGQNMAALRKAKEQAEKELNDMKDNVAGQLGQMKQQMEEKELNDTVTKIAEGDAELAKAIKENYLGMVKEGDTPEQKQKKLGDAYRLAAGSNPSPDILRSMGSAAGAPPKDMNPTAGNWPAPLVELGAKFGLTAEDLKKRTYNGK